eukprot:s2029_g15.t1
MVLSSSDSEDPELDKSPDEGDGHGVATEANAVSAAESRRPVEESKLKGLGEVRWPERVTYALKSSATFTDFKKKRIFVFAQFFPGKEDVLGGAIRRLGTLDGMSIRTIAFDRDGQGAADFLKDQPYGDILDQCRNGEVDAGHAGPPCGSFSIGRHKPGGPPAVRKLQFIYGLPTNSPKQQKEADEGSLLAIRSTLLLGEIVQSQRRRKVPEIATLENPPGTESQAEGSMWSLTETIDWMTKFQCAKAIFNTHAPIRERRRPGGSSLRSSALIGNELTSLSAKYPSDLAMEYARLVIQAFRTTLNLEWWRHLEKFKRAELNLAQVNWIKSKEKQHGPLLPEEEMRPLRANKRAWNEQDFWKDKIPQQSETKKARREFQNQYYVGGMRSPAAAVKRLGILRQAGQDIWRLRAFLKEHPAALEAARNYGTERCRLDETVAAAWMLQLGKMRKVEPSAAVKLKSKFAFESPLNATMWKAWQRYSKDPDEDLHVWAVQGAPAQPPPELEVQLGMTNYASVKDDVAGARQELDPLVS